MSKTQTNSLRLVRRVLLPLFVVAVPIAAMMAIVVYHHRSVRPAGQSPAAATASFGNDNWPVVRGDAALTGTAPGDLPSKLKVLWRFQAAGPIKSPPVVSNGTVFAASTDKHLYAISASDGSLVWKFETDSELEAGPLWADGNVYAGSSNGTLYALDAAAGTPLWQFEAGGQIAGAANTAELDGKRLILFGSYDNVLYALDAQNGASVFQHEAASYINGSPAIASQIAAFGSCDGFVHCVPLDRAKSPISIDAGAYVAASPAITDSIMYVGSYEGVFTAADIVTGQVLWRHSSQKDDAFFSSPAVSAAYVVVGCRDHILYCFNRVEGTLAWTFEAGDDFDSSPVICGDKVVVGNNDGRLYLVDLQTGKELFSYTLGSPVVSSPAIARNTLFVGCDNGLLFAFCAD